MVNRFVLLSIILCLGSFVGYGQRSTWSGKQNKKGYDSSFQQTTPDYKPPVVKKPARDLFMIDLTYSNWANKPDSVKTRPFGYGFNGYFCYDFPIKKSKLSFATGIGVSVTSVYLNQETIANTDTVTVNGYNSQAHFLPDTTHYKRYKVVTSYLSAPFELRYFSNTDNRNKGFKAAVGLKVGTLLSVDTKGVYTIDGSTVRDKTVTKRYFSPWDFAATMRVGWGNFSLYGSYNLTSVFKEDEGPVITPFSAGICLSGL